MQGVLKQGRTHRVVDSRIGEALNIIYTLSIRNRHLSQ
jgi:hypothetical protein